MGRSAVAALVVLALVGCSGGGQEPSADPASSTPATVSFPDPATAPLEPAKAKVLQDALAKIVAFPDDPSGSRGATAAVMTDRWNWSGAAGVDVRGNPLKPATSMGVASITKTFVAAEVMLLAKAGKVDLDKPLSTYVKHRLTANNATVRQHLSMTSGVQDYLPGDYAQLTKAIEAAPSKHRTAEEALSYHTAPVGRPNSPFSYSNPNYVLLGMLIEKVTGQPLATVLRRDLAAPAGLRHAAFQDGEKPQPPVVVDDSEFCGPANDGYLPCRAFASLSSANGGARGRRADGRAVGIPAVRRSRAARGRRQRNDQGRGGVRTGDDAVLGTVRHRYGVRS
ncbi:beta-lactamase family protein [Kribbella sp. NBC_01484]|uniref:serine hydrolase domain-containing protein n=1 Tax=Kribbella sp. NBC_01484 TaxID=2903579 RepID=UPI002E35CD81|nr:serine hydrolase domain-containing protein [Kribbella sp. NBC_01484]